MYTFLRVTLGHVLRTKCYRSELHVPVNDSSCPSQKYEHNSSTVDWHCCRTVHILQRQTTEWIWTKLGTGSQHYTLSEEFHFRSNPSVVTHTSQLFYKARMKPCCFSQSYIYSMPVTSKKR